MNREMEAKQTALNPLDAAKMQAGTRRSALGAAALRMARQAEQAMAGLRTVSCPMERAAKTPPGQGASPTVSAAPCRAALHQVLRR